MWRVNECGRNNSTLQQSRRRHSNDFKVIDEWCKRIGEHDAAWANYFRENQIPAFELFYEDVVANHRSAAERVLEFLRVPLPADMEIVRLGLQKQANEVSEQWTAAYLELKQASPKKRSQMMRRMKDR
jgi:LPS sulfotransferase NodH